MRTITLRGAATALALVLCAAARPAAAGIIIDINQVGADVVATGSGSVDLTGLTFSFSAFPGDTGGVFPAMGGVAMGPTVVTQDDIYLGVTGPSSFGPGGLAHATSGSGDVFGFNEGFAVVGVPLGYLSGTPLSATDTYAGQTLSSLGLNSGTYTYTFGTGVHADSIIVNIGLGPVPEPSTLVTAWLGAMIGAGYWYRRRKASATA